MKTKAKNMLLHGLGFGIGAVGLYGCYPLGVSYFAALSMAYGEWYFAFPVVMLGMAMQASVLTVVKYGIAMILCVILSGLVEERKGICSKGKMAFICGSSIFAMDLTEYYLFMEDWKFLCQSMAESILAASATVIFYQVVLFLLKSRKEEENGGQPLTVLDIGRTKLQESAKVMDKLSKCFEDMPDKKEVLSKQDVEEMFRELSDVFCSKCEKCRDCWQNHYFDTYKNTYDVFHAIERGGFGGANEETALAEQCINYKSMMSEMRRIFNKTKTNMLWYNRMIESRTAVAVQLSEMAKMMGNAAEEIYYPKVHDDGKEELIRKKLKNHHVIVEELSMIERKGKEEVYITMHVDWKRCVSVREIGAILSEICKKSFVPERDSRMLVGKERCSVLYVEDTCYKIMHGVARVAKSGERISGDNFSVLFSDDGHMTASLSDGMGNGVRANRESEMVIELFERFLEAGFCKETALGMMNATLVMNDQNGSYSTMDVTSVDLHDGTCEFVKMGASYTFIKREKRIEVIQMDTMPMGLFQKQQMIKTERKLYDGDYIVMVSDGVLADIPEEEQTKVMEEILLNTEYVNPKEIANEIMDKMLQECNCKPADDMTVLVFGLWKKF